MNRPCIDKTCFYGVGVGPGDPELLTLKAHRLIAQADVVAYAVNNSGESFARAIVRETLAQASASQVEYPIYIPMKTDRTEVKKVYDEAALGIAHYLQNAQSVVYLCEGDPLFFGSYAYLLQRLSDHYRCVTVPGISSLNAVPAALSAPLVGLSESLAVVSARHTDEKILDALRSHDSVVILKVGRNRQRLLQLIRRSGRQRSAHYIEHASTERERVVSDIRCLEPEPAEYFSLFLITRTEREF